MDTSRRKFLKIAGLTAIAGIGAPTAFNALLKGDVHASTGEEAGAVERGAAAVTTGKQLGFVIDTRKFAEDRGLAQRCIDACHSLHNVPDFGNKKDEIKWIWVENYEHAFPDNSQQKVSEEVEKLPIMTLCNHCANPPCVRACPTQATFKNADGVVMMDFHRCIGCRFCMAACPYGARSFNWRDPRPFIKKENPEFPTRMRGVVEKCLMCYERLAEGQIPACVEVSHPAGAMFFGDLNDPNSEISQVLKGQFTIQRKPSLGTRPSIFYII
jgi:molybdopterin-containing oxidoreductase family iron-sulfur binding subunit